MVGRRRRGDRLGILMYHGVESDPLPMRCWHILGARRFTRQMAYLRRHFVVLPLQEALERLDDRNLPERAVTLTFDDGTLNLARCAAPILRGLGLPAAVFLATAAMDDGESVWPDTLWLAFAHSRAHALDLTGLGVGVLRLGSKGDRAAAYESTVRRCKDLSDDHRISAVAAIIEALDAGDHGPGPFAMLSWAQACAMARDGAVTLHPHSATHPILSRCGDRKLETEIAQSCAAIHRHTGVAPTIFAYPNGRARDFDDRAKSVLRRCGVRWALATTHGFADRDCDPLALPRLAIGSDLSMAGFRRLLRGAGDGARPAAATQPAREAGSGVKQAV